MASTDDAIASRMSGPDAYLPQPEASRTGVGLCLSGGGFRAALFHLGALRRLNEVGILSQVATVSSVSGGSILAAHVAQQLRPWPAVGTAAADWDTRIAGPFHIFTSRNIRTWPLFNRLLPWHWFHQSTGVETLAQVYRERLTGLALADLPETPRFIFCATDMAYGVNWIFQRERMGDYQTGYVEPSGDWPVSRAVAASSCFPPVFNPIPMRVDPARLKGGMAPPGPERDACLRGLRLTDGGNYDNMGLEPVWKDHAVVLVSDGSGAFDPSPDRSLMWRLNRYVEIQGKQSAALRKRWLIASFMSGALEGSYWSVASDAASYGPGLPGYSEDVVKRVLAEVRTDLDAFSEGERKALENHGYLICDAAIQRHLRPLVRLDARPSAPHPDWMDEARVRTALAGSGSMKPLGRW